MTVFVSVCWLLLAAGFWGLCRWRHPTWWRLAMLAGLAVVLAQISLLLNGIFVLTNGGKLFSAEYFTELTGTWFANESAASQLVLCCWSGLLIFAWMVRTKYEWTTPPYGILFGFAVAGVVAGTGAGLINLFIGRETDFWFMSADRQYSFMGFFLGAGLSEEFWKFGVGLVLLLICWSLGRDLAPPARVLAFVALGLSFASFENWEAYSQNPAWLLLSRGLSAVPLHGTMGLIHGLAVNRAIRVKSVWPLLVGYGASAALHTLYDTAHLLLPRDEPASRLGQTAVELIQRVGVFPLVAALVLWAAVVWLRLPEITADDVGPARKRPGQLA